MRASLLLASWLLLCGASAPVSSQTDAQTPSSSAASRSQLRLRPSAMQSALDGGQVEPDANDGEENAQETIVVPPQLIPPPEPAPPRWGPLNARAPVVEYPVRDYELVGPARGVFQRFTGQVYRRRVRDPNTLLGDDYRLDESIDLDRPDGLAPAGVLGDHTLKSSRFLISYRYNVTAFDGNLNGTQPVSLAAILAGFPIAPTRETFQQHLVLLEYAPTDDLTMMLRLPIQEIDIEYVDRSGRNIHTAKTDLADIPISFMYALRRWDRQQLLLNFGLSIPTGIVDTLSDPFVFSSPNLSYRQRPSSTTWDLLPGLTYTGQSDRWSWGAQTIGTVRYGTGRYHYRLGSQVDMTAWLARRWNNFLSSSARLDGQILTNGHGADPNIDPNLTPTNRINLLGGRRLDLLFGLNFKMPDHPRFTGSRLLIESGFPIYQSLDGPQLRARWVLNASWNLIW